MSQIILNKDYQNKNYRSLANIELAIYTYSYIREDIISKIEIKGIVCNAIRIHT